jgi:hypothetical protein
MISGLGMTVGMEVTLEAIAEDGALMRAVGSMIILTTSYEDADRYKMCSMDE